MCQEKPTAEHQAETLIKNFLDRMFGRRMITVIIIAFTVVNVTLQISGHTLNAWHSITTLFSVRSSMLTSAELEVWNEWVIPLDYSASFIQAETMRSYLYELVDPIDSSKHLNHFVRNLRVVRNPTIETNWILVADINHLKSTEATVKATIECLRAKIKSWSGNDTIGSPLQYAEPYYYDSSDFTKTYGGPTNLPPDQEQGPDDNCPPIYR